MLCCDYFEKMILLLILTWRRLLILWPRPCVATIAVRILFSTRTNSTKTKQSSRRSTWKTSTNPPPYSMPPTRKNQSLSTLFSRYSASASKLSRSSPRSIRLSSPLSYRSRNIESSPVPPYTSPRLSRYTRTSSPSSPRRLNSSSFVPNSLRSLASTSLRFVSVVLWRRRFERLPNRRWWRWPRRSRFRLGRTRSKRPSVVWRIQRKRWLIKEKKSYRHLSFPRRRVQRRKRFVVYVVVVGEIRSRGNDERTSGRSQTPSQNRTWCNKTCAFSEANAARTEKDATQTPKSNVFVGFEEEDMMINVSKRVCVCVLNLFFASAEMKQRRKNWNEKVLYSLSRPRWSSKSKLRWC